MNLVQRPSPVRVKMNILSSASPSGDRFGEQTPQIGCVRQQGRSSKRKGARRNIESPRLLTGSDYVDLLTHPARSPTRLCSTRSCQPARDIFSRQGGRKRHQFDLFDAHAIKPHSQTQTKTCPIISYNGP